jgi:hypothetical protein
LKKNDQQKIRYHQGRLVIWPDSGS